MALTPTFQVRLPIILVASRLKHVISHRKKITDDPDILDMSNMHIEFADIKPKQQDVLFAYQEKSKIIDQEITRLMLEDIVIEISHFAPDQCVTDVFPYLKGDAI